MKRRITVFNTALATMMVAVTVSSVADPLPVSDQKTAETNSFDSYVRQLKQLGQEDAQGENVFQSDLFEELKKLDNLSAPKPASLLKKIHGLFSTLKAPIADRQDALNVSENKRILRQLFDERIVPIWTGTDWIDSRLLASNGFSLPDKIQQQLTELNYWEQNFGIHSVPERKTEPFSGRNIGKINGLRLAIIKAGFSVKYDKTFYIWRITGTNAPTTHIQEQKNGKWVEQ